MDWERGLIGRLLETRLGPRRRSSAQTNLGNSLGFSLEEGRQAVCEAKLYGVFSGLFEKISQRS